MEPPSGLMNMGNTCYLNTLIQCMIHSNKLRNYVLSSGKHLNEHTPLWREFGILFHQLWELKQSLVPKRFLTVVSQLSPDYLSNGYQQDMNERWCWIIDTLQKEHVHFKLEHETCDWTFESASNCIQMDTLEFHHSPREFHQSCLDAWHRFHLKDSMEWTMCHEGLLVQQICCNTCGKIYHNYEPFTSLTLEIPLREEACHLSECFQSFLKKEILNQHQQDWKCDDCNAYVLADKMVRFWKVPECLVILLKRFQYTDKGGPLKITTGVDIPLEFEFMTGTELLPMKHKTYHLKSIGNHYGNSYGGHYNSICWHKEHWWQIDDLHVELINDSTESWSRNNSNAYMLFYERS